MAREQGHGDDNIMVKAWAESADVDWRRWFARVAWDPHVNYTPDRQFRVASGAVTGRQLAEAADDFVRRAGKSRLTRFFSLGVTSPMPALCQGWP